MVNEKIGIDADDVEHLRSRILVTKRELLIGEYESYNRAYLLGLKHAVPLSLKEQDQHLRDLCDVRD